MTSLPASGKPLLGIAVTTYNRSAIVRELVEALATLTSAPYELVICDDGSTDDSVSVLRDRGIRVIAAQNRGIAWNKNRGLFYLLACTACEVVLLLDDDVLPTGAGWESDWIAAALALGHVNLLHPEKKDALIGGRGDAAEPGIATMTAGACIGSSRRALCEVGYMDTRFRNYGYEHAEYTLRFLKAGYGGALWQPEPHLLLAYYYVISSGLRLREAPTVSDYTNAERNRALALELRREDVYRHAWRDEDERTHLLMELESVMRGTRAGMTIPPDFNPEAYLERNPDVARAGVDPIYHYIAYGANEGRRWGRAE
jgi:glycosyltransferase involved in cell wall biosynthesis